MEQCRRLETNWLKSQFTKISVICVTARLERCQPIGKHHQIQKHLAASVDCCGSEKQNERTCSSAVGQQFEESLRLEFVFQCLSLREIRHPNNMPKIKGWVIIKTWTSK